MNRMKLGQDREQVKAIIVAAGSYVMWGILPIYWKLLQSVPAQEILAHRIVWSFIFLLILLTITGRLKEFAVEVYELAHQRWRMVGIISAAAILNLNWFTYIWAVNNNHVIQTSLGYYINPLVTVLLGIVVLKEKLSFWQFISFLLAAIGVLILTFHYGTVPWVALSLAITFGVYGLLKKVVNTGAVIGLTIETLLMTIVAALYLSYIHNTGCGNFLTGSTLISALLIGAGIVTAVPLIFFAYGATRLPLFILGFVQYISPTMTLLLGVFLYHEPFTTYHLISFILIWTGLIIFSLAKTNLFVRWEKALGARH